MLVNSSAREAPPLKRPAAFASFTTPSARAPLGMATLPAISTGDSIVAENLSPALAVLELMVWSSTTEMTVSAGTTKGFGSRTFFTAFFADSAADGDELAVASGPPACWLADFWPWQPAKNKPRNKKHTTRKPQRRIIKNPPILGWIPSEFKHTPKDDEIKGVRRRECAICRRNVVFSAGRPDACGKSEEDAYHLRIEGRPRKPANDFSRGFEGRSALIGGNDECAGPKPPFPTFNAAEVGAKSHGSRVYAFAHRFCVPQSHWLGGFRPFPDFPGAPQQRSGVAHTLVSTRSYHCLLHARHQR